MGLQAGARGAAGVRGGHVEESHDEEHAAAEQLRALVDVESEEAGREVDAAAAGGEAQQRAVPLKAEGEVVAQQGRLNLEHAREPGEQRDIHVQHELQQVGRHELFEEAWRCVEMHGGDAPRCGGDAWRCGGDAWGGRLGTWGRGVDA